MPAQYSHMTEKSNRLKLEYLFGGELLYQPGEMLNSRLLTDYELVYIIKGTVSYTADGTTFIAPPGSLILGSAGSIESYTWDRGQTTRHAYFHFGIKSLPYDWPEVKTWPRVLAHPNPAAIGLFKLVMQHIYQHTDWPTIAPGERDCLLVETLLDTLFEPADAEKSFEQDRPEPVRRALKWLREQLDENPHEQISLDAIAVAAGCSAKHLCRLFKQAIGHSPAQTATLLKLQLGLALLGRTNLTITEIAHRCGFENPFYFTRCFSKTFGRAPTHVRQDLAEGKPPPPAPLPIDITPRMHW